MANTIRQCDGLVSMMSYWTFSDVFEEQGVVKTPFYGGFGLIAERGIPKAAFRAFELLHKLGEQRLDAASENALVTKRADGTIVAAVWNYAEADAAGSPETVQLQFRGGHGKKYRIQRVSDSSGSPLQKWVEMGKPALPTREQIADLISASQMKPATEHSLADPIQLAPHELALIEWKP
jgi:xylan 1,4-beta-xylosidase